jgi:Na+/proline symporter
LTAREASPLIAEGLYIGVAVGRPSKRLARGRASCTASRWVGGRRSRRCGLYWGIAGRSCIACSLIWGIPSLYLVNSCLNLMEALVNS